MTPPHWPTAGLPDRNRSHACRHAGRRGVLLLSLATGWLLAACQAYAGGDARSSPQAKLMTRLEAEIGDAACTSDAQCRTLPVGEKACGGPERWLAWSTQRTQASRLKPMADELAALARQRNEQGGMLSNCQFNADPGAACVAGHCRLQSRPSVN